jgi:hypothetical protein
MNDQGSKFLVCWVVIFLAAMLAFYFGRKSGSPKKFGGVLGTMLIFSVFGLLPFFVMGVIYLILQNYLGIWSNGGDVDIGPTLMPLLVVPIYWVGAFVGMWSINRFD